MGGWVRHDEASQQGDHTPGLQIRRHTKGPYIWGIVRVLPRCWGMPARSVAKCKCRMRPPRRDLHFAEMSARSRRRVVIRAVMPPRKSDPRDDGSFGTGDASRDSARRTSGCQLMTPAPRCRAMAAGGSSRDGGCRRAHCLRFRLLSGGSARRVPPPCDALRRGRRRSGDAAGWCTCRQAASNARCRWRRGSGSPGR